MDPMLNDPFFAMHAQQIRQMESMFGSPFGHQHPAAAITDGGRRHNRTQDDRSRSLVHPSAFNNGGPSMFDGMFGNVHRMMNTMMSDMNTQMTRMHEFADNDNGHAYTHSSVMSYSNTGSGQPKIFQASSSTARAPGGVKETRKSLRDSERGIEKMSVGHHIRDRAYVKTKERDRSGNMNEDEELVNLDDDDRESFEREWQERTRTRAFRGGQEQRAVGGGRAGGRQQHGRDRYDPTRSHHHQQRPHQHRATQPLALEYHQHRAPRY